MRHPDVPTRGEVEELVGQTHDPAISIYMPTHRKGGETAQDPIRLKNLLTATRDQLLERGMEKRQVEELLAEATRLRDDKEFWVNQEDGLALFIAPGMTKVYRLPIDAPEMQAVNDRFHILPLLPMLTRNGRFYILTLSEDEVKLYDADRFSMYEVPLQGVPTSMAEALFADDNQKQLQWHTRAGSNPNGAGRAAMFHGTGDQTGMEEHKVNLKRYFDMVDKALHPVFNNVPGPVVLAGVDYLLPIYREANQSAELVEAEIHGNQEHRPLEELHKEAWEKIAPRFDQREQETMDRFKELNAKGGASSIISEINEAAESGRVDTLLVSMAGAAPTSQSLEKVNEAAIATLLKSGEVCVLEPEMMLSEAPAAAIFRY